MAHLRMLQKKIRSKLIDWTGRAGSLSQKRSKMGVVLPKVGVASQISCVLCAQDCTTTPLLEILDPPLCERARVVNTTLARNVQMLVNSNESVSLRARARPTRHTLKLAGRQSTNHDHTRATSSSVISRTSDSDCFDRKEVTMGRLSLETRSKVIGLMVIQCR